MRKKYNIDAFTVTRTTKITTTRSPPAKKNNLIQVFFVNFVCSW